MWESRVLQRAFERLELHEGKLSRAVLRGGGGGDVTSLPDRGGSNTSLLPGRSVSGSSQRGRVRARPAPRWSRRGTRSVGREAWGVRRENSGQGGPPTFPGCQEVGRHFRS